MAATASQWNEYNAIEAGFYENPEAIDYFALSTLIVEMQKAGTPFKRVVVKLRPEWPLGQRLKENYEGMKETHLLPLPPLEWQGGKNSVYNPDYVDVAGELAKLNEATAKAGSGNPFADKLAALRA